MNLVERLRERHFFFQNGGVWLMGAGPDDDCQEAAAEIDSLTVKREELHNVNEQQALEIDRLRLERNKLDAKCRALQAALKGVRDQIHGDRYSKKIREALQIISKALANEQDK